MTRQRSFPAQANTGHAANRPLVGGRKARVGLLVLDNSLMHEFNKMLNELRKRVFERLKQLWRNLRGKQAASAAGAAAS